MGYMSQTLYNALVLVLLQAFNIGSPEGYMAVFIIVVVSLVPLYAPPLCK